MKEMKARKLATGMLVAILLLSSLALLPSTTVQAAGASSAMISLNVVDALNVPVQGATITLTETHTSKTYTNTSDAGGLVTFSPLPGYYILRIAKTGYFIQEYSTIVKFDGVSSKSLGAIQIHALPTQTGTLSLTVTRASDGLPAQNVVLKTVDILASPKMEKTYPTFTGSTTQTPYISTYRLVISSVGFETEVRQVGIQNGVTTTVNVILNNSVLVNGFVYKTGVPPVGMSAVLVSNDITKYVEKRIIQAKVQGSNYFEFDAYPGTFSLMVDATDSLANMSTVTILPATPQTLTVNLVTNTGQSDVSHVSFYNNNWNTFNLTRITNMDFDAAVANIAYSNIPNIRMQIDFAFGDGNGQVSGPEFGAFYNRMKAFGPLNVTSDYLVRVSATKYMVSTDFSLLSFTGLGNTSVTSTSPYSGVMRTLYQSTASIANGENSYNVLGYAKYDTPSLDYKVTLKWPNGYEMTSNATQTTNVKVSGYLNVTIDTTVRTGTFEQVTIGIQKSVAPIAVGGASVPSTYAYAVTGTGGKILHYIVSTARDIGYTANGSSDPNGNPLKYSWNFVGQGTIGPFSSPWTTFRINAASFNISVVLTVTDVAGLTNTANFFIKTDGLNPAADFTVRNKTIAAGVLDVDQNEAVIFNGASSVDHIASPTDVGLIKTWKYTWGDGNTTTVGIGENQNVSKTYARPGTFYMSLNTTDVAGHYNIKSITVQVKDKTPPVVSYQITKKGSSAVIVTAQENETLGFSANATYDPYDPFSNLNFTWDMGDGTKKYGNYVEHYYQKIQAFSVKLMVNNSAGITANLTKTLTITSSPRPDLRIVSMVFVPNVMTEGEQGTIRVNLTNVGNDKAGAPKVLFYIMQKDGKKDFIGESADLTINGSAASELKAGQYGLITFKWTPAAKGNYTIFANAVVDREINKADNTDTSSVTVNEAAWKAIALYGGIFAVIIVVIVLFYMRKRLPKIPKLGRKGKVEEKEKKSSPSDRRK